ncbi:hypothetical protein PHMEG_00034491 [Phytophthora megakarya]|uniref:Uncharacterized protein n=1 Tax=Phytophthora megakarya TaxID=4795 RepID=A0A225UR41_9STRA|nr:hypothetical protein PHMEG_00034491 [Phytophthora megakarya]
MEPILVYTHPPRSVNSQEQQHHVRLSFTGRVGLERGGIWDRKALETKMMLKESPKISNSRSLPLGPKDLRRWRSWAVIRANCPQKTKQNAISAGDNGQKQKQRGLCTLQRTNAIAKISCHDVSLGQGVVTDTTTSQSVHGVTPNLASKIAGVGTVAVKTWGDGEEKVFHIDDVCYDTDTEYGLFSPGLALK